MINRRLGYLAMLLAASSMAVVGCSDGGGGGGGGGPAAGPTEFNEFVRNTLEAGPDSEPREVNDLDFVFTDEEDAFDDLL